MFNCYCSDLIRKKNLISPLIALNYNKRILNWFLFLTNNCVHAKVQ